MNQSLDKKIFQEFIENLERRILTNDLAGIYDMMDEEFQYRVSLENFMRHEKYWPVSGTAFKIEDIYHKEGSMRYLLRICFETASGVRHTNLVLTLKDATPVISQFLERDSNS